MRQNRDAIAVGGQNVPGLVGRSIIDRNDPDIAAGLAKGAVSFVVALLGLWFVSGRPDGMEGDILERLNIRIPSRSLA